MPTREITTTLSDAELAARARTLARMHENREQLDVERKEINDGYKRQIKAVDAGMRKVVQEIRRREGRIVVQVEEQIDRAAGQVSIIRCDTGEVIETRPMTDAERQANLPRIAPAAAAPPPPPPPSGPSIVEIELVERPDSTNRFINLVRSDTGETVDSRPPGDTHRAIPGGRVRAQVVRRVDDRGQVTQLIYRLDTQVIVDRQQIAAPIAPPAPASASPPAAAPVAPASSPRAAAARAVVDRLRDLPEEEEAVITRFSLLDLDDRQVEREPGDDDGEPSVSPLLEIESDPAGAEA